MYRFSPIKNKEELLKVIEHLHVSCNKICKQAFGEYLPVAGNIGIFCHYEDEFVFLTKLREELTDRNDNWNQKYYKLLEPIKISQKNEIPEAIYTYLYIRRPDETKPQVGDIDFVMGKNLFDKLKKINKMNNVEVFYRPDLDMFRLSTRDTDVLPYITTTFMTEKSP